jgi:two-component system sensor histidine kinase/response regulator
MSSAPQGISRAKLLIVDDEASQMKALCDTLEHEGYSTTGFTSANQALQALRELKFDLLITDLMMPEMDGITLFQAALEKDPNLVGIIMTGQGTIDTAVQAMKTGVLDYVLKPFNLTIILPVLSRALALRQLRKQNAELEQSIRERSAELEAANKELEAFSFSVSHDLRAPLRAISGFSEILLNNHSSQLPPEVQRLLGIINTSALRMGQLIEDLLRFSQLSRQPLFKRPLNTRNLVQEVTATLTSEESQRQVEIRIGDLPECVGDPALLRQVFLNLLANSFKFTRYKPNPFIEVGCEEAEGQKIYFVRDNGAGFDMQSAHRLFGFFQRLHSEKQYEGTGVGLSIVQRIVKRHGGRVWAEAEVDKGATFYFTLG